MKTDTWMIMDGESTGLAMYLRGALTVRVSLPDGRPMLTAMGLAPLLTPRPAAGQEASLDWAEKEALKIAARLSPDKSSAFEVAGKSAGSATFRVDLRAPAPAHFAEGGTLSLIFSAKTGGLQTATLGSGERPAVPDSSLATRAKVVAQLRAWDPGAKADLLRLDVRHYMGGHQLVWSYTQPAPAAQAPRTTLWDAATGGVIQSNAFDAQGKEIQRGTYTYRNPKYFPYLTRAERQKRLEEMVAARDKELAAGGN